MFLSLKSRARRRQFAQSWMAGAGDLQDAMLARHDAGNAEHHEAQRHFAALRGDTFDLGEGELG